MLINKWLVTDIVEDHKQAINMSGICLVVSGETNNIQGLYNSIQALPAKTSFSLFFSEKNFDNSKDDNSRINDIVGLFFLPGYYMVNFEPVVFIKDKRPSTIQFLDKLNEKCKKQGFRTIVINEINDGSGLQGNFTYVLDEGDFDLNEELKKWINENVKGNKPSEINLLLPAGKVKTIADFSELENKLKETDQYKVADLIYQKQKMIDESNHQLYLKEINEKNIEFYLSIQKDERASGLKWYHDEYEILPKWYKQFGHIIKVLMGKRTFKSLFRDDVKKYKD